MKPCPSCQEWTAEGREHRYHRRAWLDWIHPALCLAFLGVVAWLLLAVA